MTITLGTSLDSDNRFSHLNPVVGLTYKITPNVTAYAGYSQANRAPTPLELGCSDPAHPCLIDAFLVSDPPLKQVISYTYEAGLRGSEFGQKLKWNIGAYRTISKDDIINVASEISGFGFFQNAAKTRRQGVEAGLTYKEVRWNAYINYAFVDATFQTPSDFVFSAKSRRRCLMEISLSCPATTFRRSPSNALKPALNIQSRNPGQWEPI